MDGNAKLWQRQLTELGVHAEILGGCPPTLPAADLVVSHVLLTGSGAPHPVWDAAVRYERLGTPLLNPTSCVARCADKWQTFEAWRSAGLRQPRTWRLAALGSWPAEPVLVKPAFGESACGVARVADRAEAFAAAGDWAAETIVQEIFDRASVLRVRATTERVLGAYARPAAAIPGLRRPGPVERPVAVTSELPDLAVAAVRALGGGLIGLGVIPAADGRCSWRPMPRSRARASPGVHAADRRGGAQPRTVVN